MAGTPYTRERFEESKTYHMKHIALKPEDPGALLLGRRDRLDAYLPLKPGNARHVASVAPRQGLKDDDPMPPEVRDAYTKENSQLIDEGITDLKKAIELRPDYDDAMAYLNLLLRRKADEAATPEERADLLKQADDLVEKAKEIKQKKMEASGKVLGVTRFAENQFREKAAAKRAAFFLGATPTDQ